MRKQASVVVVTAALALSVALPALAGPPPAPWVCKDIGSPSAAGSADVDDKGVWTIKGSGSDIFGTEDSFQFCYQPVKGDVSISQRFLSMEVAEPSWTKIGLMVRENDTPGSPTINFCQTSGNGLHATSRSVQDDSTASFDTVGPGKVLESIHMRLQRVGTDVAWFWSRDGNLWVEGASSPATLPTLKEEALIGLSVTSHQDGDLGVGKVDSVNVQPGVTSAYGLLACGGDKSALIQWRPLKNAVGYNVFRGPAGATVDKLVKVNPAPLTDASFADMSEGLTNGTAMSYAVQALFKAADGKTVEGPLAAVTGTPVAAAPGFVGCSIGEGSNSGSVSFDAAKGEITLRGSGSDIWNQGDGFYFMNQLVEGDVQITATMLSKPALTHDWSKAGVMIRESLATGARNVVTGLSSANGVWQQWRPKTDAASEWPGAAAVDNDSVQLPVVVRLVRKGNTITPSYSTDGGKNFTDTEAYTFEEALPKSMYVGVAISSHDVSLVSEVKFSNLEVKKL